MATENPTWGYIRIRGGLKGRPSTKAALAALVVRTDPAVVSEARGQEIRWLQGAPSFVRGDDAGDAHEPAPAEDLAFHGQAAALVVGEAESSGSLCRAKDPVFLKQVVNDRLLLSVDPTREQQAEEGERRR